MRGMPTPVGRRIAAAALSAIVAVPIVVGATSPALAEPVEIDETSSPVEPASPTDAAASEGSEGPEAPAVPDPSGTPAVTDQSEASAEPVAPVGSEPSTQAPTSPTAEDGAADAVATGIAPGEVRRIAIPVVDAISIRAVVTAPLGVEVRITGPTGSSAWVGGDTTRKSVSTSISSAATGEFGLEIRNGTDAVVEAAVETSFARPGSVRLDPRVSLAADRLTITTSLDGPDGPVTGATVSARITADNGIWQDTMLTEVRTGVYEVVTGVMRSGDYTVRVVSTIAGVEHAAVALGRIVGTDTTGPAVTIATDPAQPNARGWHVDRVDLLIDAVDPQGVFAIWYRVGDGPLMTAAGGVRIPVTGDGEQLVTAWAWDRLFNISAPITVTVRADRSGPIASVAGVLGAGVVAQGAHAPAEFTCTDQHSGIEECRLEIVGGGVLAPGDPLPTGTIGTVQYAIVTTNGAGLGTRAIGQFRVDDDAVAPSIAVTTTPAASNARGWFARDVVVEIVASDTGSGVAWVEVRVDGGPWERTAGHRVEVPVDRDGDSVIEFRAADVAGNTTGIRERLIRLDRVAPTAVIDPAVDGAVVPIGSTLVAAFDCTDAHSGVLDCIGSTSAGTALPTDAAGVFELAVTVTDRAGNLATTRAEYEVVAAPLAATATPSTAPNEHGWWRDEVVVELAVVDGSGAETVHWMLDGAQTGSGEAVGSATVVVDVDGLTRLQVWASDGNGSSEPVSLELAIDREAPEFWHSFAVPENLVAAETEALPVGLRFELGETVHFAWGCVEDDLSWLVDCESDLVDRVLPTEEAGVHELEFRSSDLAGNERREVLRYVVVDPAAEPGPVAGGGAPQRGGLAVTGLDAVPPVIAGGALVALGLVVLLVARRRRA